MLTFETIKKDTRWVAKMNGYRVSGTYDEVSKYADDEECRDFDISCKQPDHLKEYYDMYFGQVEAPIYMLKDFYEKVYVPKMTDIEAERAINRREAEVCRDIWC